MTDVREKNEIMVEYEGRLATVTINRRKILNSLDENTIKLLTTKLKEVATSTCDVVIIRGEGRAFSIGGDIKGMLMNEDKTILPRVMDAAKELSLCLYTLPKIVISAINGACVGAGLSIALAADYVYANSKAPLAMNFIGLGLIPDVGGHFFVQNRIGEVKAKQLIWEGQKLTAEEALNIGLIDGILSDDFQESIKEKAKDILQKPTLAMIETKKLFTALNKEKLLQVLKLETIGQLTMRNTKDHQEGLSAFSERRTPQFLGE
ncbi:enoyl-CoA hydratase [Priestia taiwanensis]|uniref:Enoyl-CoA hydratase n=1 Tax=Priestia taiwanensis TaxID=1347902 RepID=A0A917AP50_9BACI|nr:enoyl-CoA hydratase [Priestia taiwanensis]MBM7362674.1 enoyl-CoA hydratase/carnithine racemase [Priestia taiwanensis]GGE64106.1 enoyl-CoA hydratase [Priestia taiwanensis]